MFKMQRVRAMWNFALGCALALTLAGPVLAHGGDREVVVDGLGFDSWIDYARSEYFKASDRRCATPEREVREQLYGVAGGLPTDCSAGSTNPSPDYDSTVLYEIPVVVHIIMNDAGTQGVISDELVHSQIDIMNEDFLALVGTNGANGTDVQFHFSLAQVDPDGNPTTGITRSQNSSWFNDGGGYFNTLAWDPNRYLNIYTNQASGALGYVPFLPADGGGVLVGGNSDRVVILWDTFGRDAPFGPPYDQGRTVTHEFGHYFGLEHTFNGGCASGTPPGCYTSGDLICDTNSESGPVFSPCFVGASNTCGSVDPSDNYMDYSDDLCMMKFTAEQSRRMRCTIEFYRPDLFTVADEGLIFEDGFEAGDTSSWSDTGP